MKGKKWKIICTIICISVLLSSCAVRPEAKPQETPAASPVPTPAVVQSSAPSQPGLELEQDFQKYEDFVQDKSEDKLVFSHKADLDLDGNAEIVLAYGNGSKEPDMTSISQVYLLRDRDGVITRLDDDSITTGGYGVNEIKLVHLEDMPKTYIYCGLTNGASMEGFAVYEISGESVTAAGYSASASGQGEDVLQDFNDNGLYDGYTQNRSSYDVYYNEVNRTYVLEDGEFQLSRTSVTIPEYPEEIREVILQFFSLSALQDGTAPEIDQRLAELFGPDAAKVITSLPEDWEVPISNTILEIEGGMDIAIEEQGNKATAIVSYPEEPREQEKQGAQEGSEHSFRLTFTLQKDNHRWHIISVN